VHSLNANFNTWNALSGKYIWTGGSVSVTNNDFATQTYFDEFGRTYSKTVNVDGNVNAFLWGGAGYPILNRKIEFNPSFDASFLRFKSFIGDLENVTDNFAVTPKMGINFRLDSLEIELEGSYSYNNPVSSLSSASNTPFTIQNYSVSVNWRLKRGFGISTDANYTKNAQPGGGFFNTNFFVLNAEVNKKFLKTENLMLALVGNDIFNQNINARRVVNGNVVTDFRTTIISRYFLLKLTYRFNNRKTNLTKIF
jgi:hypothetical protein